ncbi:MAG: hypothetical protein ACLU4P_10920 [Ruminococcus sp.]
MKKNHHLHRLVRLCLIISLLLLCSTSQVFAAAKVNLEKHQNQIISHQTHLQSKSPAPEGKRHL